MLHTKAVCINNKLVAGICKKLTRLNPSETRLVAQLSFFWHKRYINLIKCTRRNRTNISLIMFEMSNLLWQEMHTAICTSYNTASNLKFRYYHVSLNL